MSVLLDSGDLRLALIEEMAPCGTWQWSVGSNDLYWSPGLYKLLGVDPSIPATLDLYTKLVHPDDRLDFGNPARVAVDGSLAARQFRVLRPNGELRVIRSYGRLLHTEQGEAKQMIGVAFDATDTLRGVAALRRQNSLLDAIGGLFGVTLWQTEPDGSVSDVADWHDRVGMQGFDPSGWGRIKVVHPEDRPLVTAAWKEAILHRKLYDVTVRVIINGSEMSLRSRAIPIIGASEILEGWLGFTVPVDQVGFSSLSAAEDLTPALIRAGRGLLDWSLDDLAHASRLSFSTIRRAEGSARLPSTATMDILRRTFEQHGLKFIKAGQDLGVVKSSGR